MNDNDILADYGVPEWACDIVGKRDLGLRVDNPLAASTALLKDAGKLSAS